MARVHTFYFLVNEAGEPIADANISIFLAGTETPATIYTDEFSNAYVNTAPHMISLSNGYIEWWTGDKNETYGYANTQKFKIKWEKVGISSGIVDYIDIFPAVSYVEPVDETDIFSIVKDKTVSNALAYEWTEHARANILTTPGIHGLMLATPTEFDTIPNKLIHNRMAWYWDRHYESTVQTFSPSAGTPHGIEEVDPLSTTTIKNKLVSNELINTIHQDISNIDGILDGIREGRFIVGTGDWTASGDTYWTEVTHSLDIEYPMIICWNTDTHKVEKMTDIEMLTTNKLKITSSETLNLSIRITT